MNNTLKTLFSILVLFSSLSCNKIETEKIKYLDVNAHNLSGSWELVEWNGATIQKGTYVYMHIVRNDMTYTLYQNMDSYANIPHVVTGRYYLSTDPEIGAIIGGNYDHDSGDWAHRYIVKDLTATQMTWVSEDDSEEIQKFVRIDDIPVQNGK